MEIWAVSYPSVTMNNTALNICVWVSVWTYILILGYIYRSRITESHGNSVQVFEKLPNFFPKKLHYIIPYKQHIRIVISPTPCQYPFINWVFYSIHSSRWEGVSLWFWFWFPRLLIILNIFSCAYWPFMYL
jgi:hypothetical protein